MSKRWPGFHPVPPGWNSAHWSESVDSHYSERELKEKILRTHFQEWRIQIMNEPGSCVVQYTWACENSSGVHLKESIITMDIPPKNLAHAREALLIYMNDHPAEFGLDLKINGTSWNPH